MRALGWQQALFIAVAALQVLAILGFAGARELALRRGTEVVLATVPVDPRDLFRGDYVVLRYEVSTVPCSAPVGATVYVPLKRSGEVFEAGRIGAVDTVDRALDYADEGLFLRGRVERSSPGPEGCLVAYEIESYFVPEGTGREIERLRGQPRVQVSVDGTGHAVIKGLILPEEGTTLTPTPVVTPAWGTPLRRPTPAPTP